MHIRAMRVTPIALPAPPLRSAFGLHAPYTIRTVIELESDTGLIGLSETHGGDTVLRDLEAARPLVEGRDPYHLTDLEARLCHATEHEALPTPDTPGQVQPWDGVLSSPVRTFGAIEVACLDLIGQATGRPLCDLLGGRFREHVEFSAYLFCKFAGVGGTDGVGKNGIEEARQATRERTDYLAQPASTPAELVAQAQGMCARHGFRSLKLKGGVLPPDEEVQTLQELRRVFGANIPLRIDPNATWTVPTAIRCGRQLEPILEYYEDPTAGKEGMGQVARQVELPLATNMICTAFEDLPLMIKRDAAQIVLSDHHLWGGLLNSMHLAKICTTWHLGFSMHSNFHAGISLLAMTHLAAAVPNLDYACDTHYPWLAEDILEGGRLTFVNGSLPVPTTPGLGATLDREALARMHANYLHAGITHRDDAAEMRKIQPDWQPPLW